MALKLFEYRITKTDKQKLNEAGASDFFKGLAQGFGDAVKKELGIKTKDELAQEAEEAYNQWFSSKGFKEYESHDPDVFKAYILPLGSSDDGIIFEFKLTPEAQDYVEGKTDEEIKDNPNVTKICDITMFDIPIDLNAVKTIAPAIIGDSDFNGIDNLMKKEYATLDTTTAKPLNDNAKEYLDNLNANFLRPYKLNLFDSNLTSTEKIAFQNLIKNGTTDNLNDIVVSNVANGLAKKHETIETIQKLGKYDTLDEMAEDFKIKDPENVILYQAIIDDIGPAAIEQTIKDGNISKDYQYRMLVMSLDKNLNSDIENHQFNKDLLTKSKIKV